jgi:hypothetical protein
MLQFDPRLLPDRQTLLIVPWENIKHHWNAYIDCIFDESVRLLGLSLAWLSLRHFGDQNIRVVPFTGFNIIGLFDIHPSLGELHTEFQLRFHLHCSMQ